MDKDNELCPYFHKRCEIVRERNYLSRRVEEMEEVMKLAREEILSLREKVKLLEEEKQNLQEELKQSNSNRKSFKQSVKKEEEKEEKKKGAPIGHTGYTRKKPKIIDEYIRITHKKCRFCGSENVTTYKNFEEHIVEDLEIKVKTTCYLMHYGYCNNCKKIIYPKVEGIIPNSRIGPKARAISEYLHYIGISYLNIEKIFRDIFSLDVTSTSFINFDKKIAQNGKYLYDQIKNMVRRSNWICVDETSWRVDGENEWLWLFTNKELTFYRIEKTRGSIIVEDTLGKEYNGILNSDFYSAYNSIKANFKQKSLSHLLGEIKKIEERGIVNDNEDKLLCEKLKSTLKSAIEVWNKFKEREKTIEELKAFKEIVAAQLTEIVMHQSENKDIKRLQKRLLKHNDEILTFLEHPDVEPTNNRAERQLRPNVIMRKITYGNRSDVGAKNHSIMMSILQTGILNNKKPIEILMNLTVNKNYNLEQLTNKKIRAP